MFSVRSLNQDFNSVCFFVIRRKLKIEESISLAAGDNCFWYTEGYFCHYGNII